MWGLTAAGAVFTPGFYSPSPTCARGSSWGFLSTFPCVYTLEELLSPTSPSPPGHLPAPRFPVMDSLCFPLQMEKDETVSDSSPHIANIGRLVEVSAASSAQIYSHNSESCGIFLHKQLPHSCCGSVLLLPSLPAVCWWVQSHPSAPFSCSALQ